MLSYEENLLKFGRQLSLNSRLLSSENTGRLRGEKTDGIVVFGMGGSGIPGLILEKLAGEVGIPVPVLAVRDGVLPKLYFKRPFFIAVSFSGNTAETLACLRSALSSKKRAGLAVVTGGGKLKILAERHKLPLVLLGGGGLTPHINLCGGLTPRECSGTMFFGIVRILKSVFPVRISPPLKFRPLILKNLGNKLARAAKNRNVLIYTDYSFAHLGYIWKTNLNETAKVPAFTNVYPELNHNEVAGFEKKSGRWLILWLKDRLTATEKGRIKILKGILEKEGVKNVEVSLPGQSKSEKTWNGVVLSHWMAFFLAEMNGVDPRKTRIIDELKEKTR